jgi:rfaE bifunctional protein kinase chain/domain
MKMKESKLVEYLQGFHQTKVGVLGDVGIDRYTWGSVERISPEAPVPIVRVDRETLKLGLAANVAENITALGGRPEIVGVVGADRDASDLKAMLRKNRIDPSRLIADSTRRTILKERIVAETQQLLRVDFEDLHPLHARVRSQIKTQVNRAFRSVDAIIIEDYAKGLLDRDLISHVIAIGKKRGIPVLVDPHLLTKASVYKGVTLLTPNKREAEALSGVRIHDRKSLAQCAANILRVTESAYVVITLGKEGMAIFKKGGGAPIMIPTFAQEVYDVSGAGDTVISTLALALASNVPIADAGLVSNLAAGVEVGKRGTATVTRDEILQAYARIRITGRA